MIIGGMIIAAIGLIAFLIDVWQTWDAHFKPGFVEKIFLKRWLLKHPFLYALHLVPFAILFLWLGLIDHWAKFIPLGILTAGFTFLAIHGYKELHR